MMLYIYTKFHENILDGIKIKERTRFPLKKILRRIMLHEIVGEVAILVLCTSFDGDLFSSPVS